MLRRTPQVEAILGLFLEDPTLERYGLEVAQKLGLKSGVLYPALHRLHSAGWLSRASEKIDPHSAGRPARRMYRLTPLGEQAATEWLLKPRRLPSTPVIGRPQVT